MESTSANPEKQSESWQKIILDQGYSGISSVFKGNEFNVGGTNIKTEPGKYKAYIVHRSQKSGVVLPETFEFVYSLVESSAIKRLPIQPGNTDILVISDLKNVSSVTPGIMDFDNNLRDVCRNMFGVIYQSLKADSSKVHVGHLILLPKSFAKQFTDDSLTDPKFCINLTNKLLSGVDNVLPRQKPETIIVFAGNTQKKFNI